MDPSSCHYCHTGQLRFGKLAVFPVGEKLIAPGMQRIEYAVIHKTKRSKEELHITK
jgi:hypothetical protein